VGVKRDQKTPTSGQPRAKLLKKSESGSFEDQAESSNKLACDLSRKRKLDEDCDNSPADFGMVVWKKKRAALELRQSAQNEAQSLNQFEVPTHSACIEAVATSKMAMIGDDQLMGALALMELATQAPVEASSEIDVISSEPCDFFASSQGDFSVIGGDKFGTSMSTYSHQVTYDESSFFS
jgi:hypothetical protein